MLRVVTVPLEIPQNFTVVNGSVNATHAVFTWFPVNTSFSRIRGFFRGYQVRMVPEYAQTHSHSQPVWCTSCQSYRSIYASLLLQLRSGGFSWSRTLLPLLTAISVFILGIRCYEFSSMVLLTPSACCTLPSQSGTIHLSSTH